MSGLDNFPDDFYKELRKLMYDKIQKVKRGAKTSKHRLDGVYEGATFIRGGNNHKRLEVTFWGQGMWIDEFGKGLGIGLPDDIRLFAENGKEETEYVNYARMAFKHSRIWQEYCKGTKNPMRTANRNKFFLKDTGQKIKATIKYTRKDGTAVQYSKTKNLKARVRDTNKDVRIYSRPGGYVDIDGRPHSSNAKHVYPIESERRMRKHPEQQVSHGGSFRITQEFHYDFLRNKPVGNFLTEAEADKISDELCEKVEKYINDLF